MKDFIEYIESSCQGLKDNRMTYLYKRKLLGEMTERANEITHAGLKDEKVLADLIADEFGDIKGNFPKFEKEERKRMLEKKLKVILPIGGIIFFILMFVAYFFVSDLTKAWDKSWLIIVGGVFFLIIFYLSFAINKIYHMKQVFHPIARVMLIGCVILFMVFTYLFWLMMLPGELTTWPIVPAGVMLALIADLIFAYSTKQKFRMISFFIYMPAIATMIYIVLAAYHIVSWGGGWPIILLGLVVDLIYILAVIMNNMKYFMYKQEVD